MNHEDDTYIASPMTEAEQTSPYIAMVLPGELPERIIVNGVSYLRASGFVDEQVNLIQQYEAIAARTSLSVRQAIWFAYRDEDSIMPD